MYKAKDMCLQRIVALKFISNDLAHDPDYLERFRREVASEIQIFKEPTKG